MNSWLSSSEESDRDFLPTIVFSSTVEHLHDDGLIRVYLGEKTEHLPVS